MEGFLKQDAEIKLINPVTEGIKLGIELGTVCLGLQPGDFLGRTGLSAISDGLFDLRHDAVLVFAQFGHVETGNESGNLLRIKREFGNIGLIRGTGVQGNLRQPRFGDVAESVVAGGFEQAVLTDERIVLLRLFITVCQIQRDRLLCGQLACPTEK